MPTMRLPIRNKSARKLTVFVEPLCDQYEVPAGGEAIIRLEDGPPHSIDVDAEWVTVWDEGASATVEVISESDRAVDEALSLAVIWLHNLGAKSEGIAVNEAVESLEPGDGYLGARAKVFGAFYDGFRGGRPPRPKALAACFRAGETAARLNQLARTDAAFPGLGIGPFDTDTVEAAFKRAAIVETAEKRKAAS
jgi:hypothetical protein